MRWLGAVAATAACVFGVSSAQERGSTFSPERPPAIPLAVRSPYLNVWQQAGGDGANGGYLAGQWPTFWLGQIVGWTGMVRVDNLTYTWMGAPMIADGLTPPVVNQTSFNYTSTRSIFTFDVDGAVKMVVTFLSPVTPTDFNRQSFPISYMNVDVSSLDGKNHDVQIYTDMTGEWASGDRSALLKWDYGSITGGRPATNQFNLAGGSDAGTLGVEQNTGTSATTYATNTQFSTPNGPVRHPTQPVPRTSGYVDPTPRPSPTRPATTFEAFAKPSPTSVGGIAYHRFYRQIPLMYSEISDQTEYGNWYYLTDNTADLTHQSGSDAQVRGAFDKNGYLRNTNDKKFRAINDQYPTFGYAVSLGTVGKSTKSHKFAVALAQEEAVQFQGANRGTNPLKSLWTDYYDSEEDALNFYFNDYNQATTLAKNFDSQIESDSKAAGGENYAILTSLAVRQAFGSLEFANNAGQPLLFMKEISSDGNVNTADVIYPFSPISLYLNPNLLRMLLDPLFINQEAGNWPRAYAMHDVGSAFPNATGHSNGMAEDQPVEECGNMILMALAYAQKTGDTAYLKKHYALLRQWVEYLVELSLIPENQLSTDDFAGALPNQTNLAIKGILGIGAMGKIADLTGHPKDSRNYTNISRDYVKKWQTYGINKNANPPHSELQYGNASTWSILYNIYNDKLLSLDLVPQSVFDMQSKWYATKFHRYGVPLDNRHDYTKGDWELFAAAVASADVRQRFVDALALWVKETPGQFPLSDLYFTTSGAYQTDPPFRNRPVVGGFFALLALGSGSGKRDAADGALSSIAGRIRWPLW